MDQYSETWLGSGNVKGKPLHLTFGGRNETYNVCHDTIKNVLAQAVSKGDCPFVLEFSDSAVRDTV